MVVFFVSCHTLPISVLRGFLDFSVVDVTDVSVKNNLILRLNIAAAI